MEEAASPAVANVQQNRTENYISISHDLLVIIIITSIMWYIQYRWKWRRVYKLMASLKQPTSAYPIFGHSLQFLGTPTDVFKKITEIFFEYGPNFGVWFGPIPMVVIGKPEDLETVMRSPHCVDKGYFYKFTKFVVGDGVFSAPVHKWRINRKLIQPTFNSRILDDFVQIFVDTSTTCVNEVLPKYLDKKDIDWYKIFTAVNVDTISQTAMGVNSNAQREEIPISKHLETAMKVVYMRFVRIHYHLDIIFNRTSLYRELVKSVEYMDQFTGKVIQEKRAKMTKKLKEKEENLTFDETPMKRKVFLEMLLEIGHKGIEFTDEELKNEMKTFYLGGTDTSAVAACFFLSMMGMHQNIQQQVYEEIIEVLGEERSPEPEDLPKLQLLERCIKESMRLFPPVPFISRIVQEEEVKLSECTLPVGTTLLFSIYYAHRSANYWDEPLQFKPERFLPDEVQKRHPYSFVAFSGGLRGCLGVRYAHMSLKTLLSMLLRKYKVHCDYKSIEEIEVKNYIVLRPTDGFKFHIEERD